MCITGVWICLIPLAVLGEGVVLSVVVLQLVVERGEHQVAAVHRSHPARRQSDREHRRQGGAARPRPLLRRVGPHSADCCCC